MLLGVSCAAPIGAAPPEVAPSPRSVAAPAAPEEALTLEKLLAIAFQASPQIAVARARVDTARGKMIQAGLYPNPIVTPRVDDLGNRFNAAGLPALTLQQEVVTAGKLKLATAAAAYGVTAFDWQALTQWYLVVTKVRQAYYEALTATRDVETNEDLVRIVQEGLDDAIKLEKAGAGARPDVIRARVELEQNRIRLIQARQRLNAAMKLLAAAMGVPALPPGRLTGNLEDPSPRYEYQSALATALMRSSEIQEAQALQFQAERLLRRAEVQKIPNLMLMARPIYSAPDGNWQVLLEAGFALPIYNRYQGDVAAARADLARTAQEVRQVELRLTERLAAAFQLYEAAREQTDVYEKQILPNAREAVRLVRIGYERGDPKFDYTALLQAQRILVQVRLGYVQVLGDLWRSASDIAGLIQIDEDQPRNPHGHSGPGIPVSLPPQSGP